jgi:hypothetical protein
MSSKKTTEVTVAIPGEDGWQLWQRQNGTFQMTDKHLLDEDGSVEPFRTASHYAFPVVSAFAAPLWVATDDPVLTQSIVEMQLEKLGLRPDETNGRLLDHKLAVKGHGEAVKPGEPAPIRNLVLATVLSSNYQHALPRHAPDFFEVSPRFFVLPGNHVTVWKELGRVVLAVTSNDQLVYFQSLTAETIDEQAVREIKCLLMQLRMEGTIKEPSGVIVWTDDITPELLIFARSTLGMDVDIEDKPRPVLPARGSKLVPAEVAIIRENEKRRKKIVNVLMAFAALYLIGVGAMAFDYFLKLREVRKHRNDLVSLSPQVEWIPELNRRWAAIEPAVDANQYPMELYYRSIKLLPPKGVRFASYVQDQATITLSGEAINTAEANRYGGEIFKAEDLSDYKWNWIQRPVIDTKKRERTASFKIQGENIYGETKN